MATLHGDLWTLEYQGISSSEDQQRYSVEKHLISSFIILFVLSVVGNTFVICHILRNAALRKKHCLFLNLSVADLLGTLTTHLYKIIDLTSGPYWKGGNVFCKIYYFVMLLMEAGTMSAILIIAINQFLVLVKPPCPHLPTKVAIPGSWLLSILPALPFLYTAGKVDRMNNHYLCFSLGNLGIRIAPYVIYMPLHFIFYYYLPLLTGAIMFALVFLKAKPWSWLRVPSEKSKIFILSLTLYTTALFTSIPFLIEQNISLFYLFDASTLLIDVWLYLVVLSRNTINPYIYIVFHFKEIVRGRAVERTSSVPLGTPFTENVVSSTALLPQETTA